MRLNPVTRMYFEQMSTAQPEPIASQMKALLRNSSDASAAAALSAVPYYNAVMRTTCVATQLDGGHAVNALPQTARATVHCRLLPDESPEEVIRGVQSAVAAHSVTVTGNANPILGTESPLDRDVLGRVSAVAAEMWPGVPVVPLMEVGGTDGRFLRAAGIPTYGISGLFDDVDDVRMHGKDERVAVDVFYEGLEFHYRLAKALTGGR